MFARLVSIDESMVIRLTRPLTLVGRHADCEVRLHSSRVSRRHCCLAFDAGGLVVRDLGSVNGTWVNGIRIEEGFLRPGDTLTIGHLRFRLDILESPDDSGTQEVDKDPSEAGAC